MILLNFSYLKKIIIELLHSDVLIHIQVSFFIFTSTSINLHEVFFHILECAYILHFLFIYG